MGPIEILFSYNCGCIFFIYPLPLTPIDLKFIYLFLPKENVEIIISILSLERGNVGDNLVTDMFQVKEAKLI